MKKICAALLVAVVALLFASSSAIAQPQGTTERKIHDTVLNVEMWSLILGSCEKVVLNDAYQSGLTRCYYLDPMGENGIGATTEAFYKDGSTHLYWKGWALHTNKEQIAQLLDSGNWYVTPPSKMLQSMGYLTAMRAFFEKALGMTDAKLIPEKLTHYMLDQNGEPMKDKITTIYLNKNSAHDPNPIK